MLSRRLFNKLLLAIPFAPSLLEKLPVVESKPVLWKATYVGHINSSDGSCFSSRRDEDGTCYYRERDKDGNIREWVEYS